MSKDNPTQTEREWVESAATHRGVHNGAEWFLIPTEGAGKNYGSCTDSGYKGYCLFPADFCGESIRTESHEGKPGVLDHVRPYISLSRSDASGWLIGYLPGDCDLDVDQVKDAEESAAYCRGIIDNVIRVEPDVARAKEVYDDAQVEVAFILNSMENRHADDVASKG